MKKKKIDWMTVAIAVAASLVINQLTPNIGKMVSLLNTKKDDK